MAQSRISPVILAKPSMIAKSACQWQEKSVRLNLGRITSMIEGFVIIQPTKAKKDKLRPARTISHKDITLAYTGSATGDEFSEESVNARDRIELFAPNATEVTLQQ